MDTLWSGWDEIPDIFSLLINCSKGWHMEVDNYKLKHVPSHDGKEKLTRSSITNLISNDFSRWNGIYHSHTDRYTQTRTFFTWHDRVVLNLPLFYLDIFFLQNNLFN